MNKHDTNFNYAIEIILKHEGGSKITNNKNDPGGLTRYGISHKAFPNVDIRNLTLEKAKDIYYNNYWIAGKYYRITDKFIATKLFDIAVNMGIRQSAKIAQRACNAVGYNLVVDGILGNKSFEAINDIDQKILLPVLRAEQWAYYRIIMTRNKKLRVFKNGWRARAYS